MFEWVYCTPADPAERNKVWTIEAAMRLWTGVANDAETPAPCRPRAAALAAWLTTQHQDH